MSKAEAISELPTLSDVLYTGDTTELVVEAQWVALLQSVATRNERGLRELFTHSHGAVFAYVSRLVGDRGAAEQITVEVFYDVWQHAASYDPAAGSVLGWIMSQARSRAIDSLRSSRHHNAGQSGGSADARPAAVEPDGGMPQ